MEVSTFTPPSPDYTPADVYRGLRDKVISLSASEDSSSHPDITAVLMETGYPQAVATLVVVADGSTSLYFSNGGGIIGAGQHAPVRAASAEFLKAVEANVQRFGPTTTYPLPRPKFVRFYVLSGSGNRTVEAPEEDLGRNRHPLSPIFHLAHGVIAAIREHAESRK